LTVDKVKVVILHGENIGYATINEWNLYKKYMGEWSYLAHRKNLIKSYGLLAFFMSLPAARLKANKNLVFGDGKKK